LDERKTRSVAPESGKIRKKGNKEVATGQQENKKGLGHLA
jgi:hypothetical protein